VVPRAKHSALEPMANHRKIPEAGYQRLLAVALLRRQLPTNAELAAEYGCTERGIRDAMQRLLLSCTTVSGEIDFGTIRSLSLPTRVVFPCPGSPNRSKNRTS
jgi:hypothetical protein